MSTNFNAAIVEVQCPICRCLHYANPGTTNYSTFGDPCDECLADARYGRVNTENKLDKHQIEVKELAVPPFAASDRQRNIAIRSILNCLFLMLVVMLVAFIFVAFQPLWQVDTVIVTKECSHGNWNNVTFACDCYFGYQRVKNDDSIHKCDYVSKFKSTAIYLQMNPLTGLFGWGMWYIQRYTFAVIQFLVTCFTMLLHVSRNRSHKRLICCGDITAIILWLVSFISLFGEPWVDGNGYSLA